MGVREAAQKAKDYIGEIFSDECIKHLALEEVVFDDDKNHWKITIGFSRPWDRVEPIINIPGGTPPPLRRVYKIVRIDDADGKILSLENRD